jgi:hypothetical protein
MPPGPGEPLPSWNDGPGKRAVLDFVSRLSKRGGPDFVLENDRIAVFDNDGTLWSTCRPTSTTKRGSRSAEREFAYDRQHVLSDQLDKGLDEASRYGWTLVDMKRDWKVVFPPTVRREPVSSLV